MSISLKITFWPTSIHIQSLVNILLRSDKDKIEKYQYGLRKTVSKHLKYTQSVGKYTTSVSNLILTISLFTDGNLVQEEGIGKKAVFPAFTKIPYRKEQRFSAFQN